jgi:hypothetical protein
MEGNNGGPIAANKKLRMKLVFEKRTGYVTNPMGNWVEAAVEGVGSILTVNINDKNYSWQPIQSAAETSGLPIQSSGGFPQGVEIPSFN